jgi:hypothetical protein
MEEAAYKKTRDGYHYYNAGGWTMIVSPDLKEVVTMYRQDEVRFEFFPRHFRR